MSIQSPKLVEAASIAERHSYLVDKKYGGGLSKEEAEELANLKQQLDDENAAFYEPIIQQLTAIEEQLRAKSQRQLEKG